MVERTGLWVGLLAMTAVACAGPAKTATLDLTQAAHHHDPHDHNHSRGKMLEAFDGKVAALLTSHLSSKTGNELDVFVEEAGAPRALAVTKLTAAVTGAAEPHTLTFECAPADERPAGEKEGTCSHFVAKAPWMTTSDRLRVEAALPLGDREQRFVWRDFDPKRFAHHEE